LAARQREGSPIVSGEQVEPAVVGDQVDLEDERPMNGVADLKFPGCRRAQLNPDSIDVSLDLEVLARE
jgi:hypothetical protein